MEQPLSEGVRGIRVWDLGFEQQLRSTPSTRVSALGAGGAVAAVAGGRGAPGGCCFSAGLPAAAPGPAQHKARL